jgi:hypothetical protein
MPSRFLLVLEMPLVLGGILKAGRFGINASFDIVDIGINVRCLGIGVGLLVLILYIEAALDV